MGRLISGRTACAPALPFPESDAETDDGMRGALGRTTVLPSEPHSVHHSRPHHQAAQDVRTFADRNLGVDSPGVADARNELMDAGNALREYGNLPLRNLRKLPPFPP